MTATAPVLRLAGITKRFGRLVANDAISLAVGAGEVLALLGENGAGKTTLMNILFGHYAADAGTVEVFGQRLPRGRPAAALAAGVGMVHQHFALADNLSVLDNIILGTVPWWRPHLDRAGAARRVVDLARQCGFTIDPARPVRTLAVGERQKVEVLKALYRGARILILDEPTAVLTPQEAQGLFATVRQLASGGMAVVLITHRLGEVMAVSDQVCVLRHGKVVHTTATAAASAAQLARAMVGSDIAAPPKGPATPGAPLLKLAGVGLAAGAGPTLDGIDLELREREILGITGVAGNGQRELAAVLCGVARPARGTLEWAAAPGRRHVPASALPGLGVARIPDDRAALGVVGDMTVAENLISATPRAFARWGLLRPRAIAAHARRLVKVFDVRCDTVTAPARLLSGGNMQKLILARELAAGARVIIANQPTRGLDVGAIAGVHRRLLDARAAGAGIVLITEDLDELFALADRVAVMYRGRLGQFAPAADLDAERVGLLMGGLA